MNDWNYAKPTRQPAQTTPGVRMLKDLWNIGKKKDRETVTNVSTDIYNTAPSKNNVPRRHRSGT